MAQHWSREFLSYVREVVPPEMESIIEDLFETITLYDNRRSTTGLTSPYSAGGSRGYHWRAGCSHWRNGRSTPARPPSRSS